MPEGAQTSNVYDKAARYAAKLGARGFVLWIVGVRVQHRRWLDTRLRSSPDGADLIADTIMYVIERENGRPWAIIFEFKVKPDLDVLSQVRSYEAEVHRQERPDHLSGSRMCIASIVLNLRGRQRPFEAVALGDTGLVWTGFPLIVHLSQMVAETILQRIENNELPLTILPWVPLMQGADESGIIERWKKLAGQEKHAHRKSDYGALALIFADAAKRRKVWKKALKGWNMTESKVVNEWIREARIEALARGREEGKVVGRIQLLQEMLGLPVSTNEELNEQNAKQLAQLEHQLREKLRKSHTNGRNGAK